MSLRTPIIVLAPSLLLVACNEPAPAPTAPAPMANAVADGPPPAPLATIAFGDRTLEFWPFTGTDFSGTPADPVNVIFLGQGDPRAIRAGLMMLDGRRAGFGFPDAFPFDCTWQDAIGGVQTAYTTSVGWTGSAVQLACGPYGPVRFHLRLFGAGAWTVANAHFEVLIPGTTEHQVLNWEIAEQLVVVDLLRSGLLDAQVPLVPTGPINPSPFREIPALVFNGLPAELRAVAGGPPGDVSGPVPLLSDGSATVLNVAASAGAEPVVARQELVITFDQVIPKPFCVSGAGAFLQVNGPVRLRQQVVVTAAGGLVSQFHALGTLDVVPVDVSRGVPVPVGSPYRAHVVEHHRGVVTDATTLVSSLQLQAELPPGGSARGRIAARLEVGPGSSSRYTLAVRCSP
jgi:hypothetical protein